MKPRFFLLVDKLLAVVMAIGAVVFSAVVVARSIIMLLQDVVRSCPLTIGGS